MNMNEMSKEEKLEKARKLYESLSPTYKRILAEYKRNVAFEDIASIFDMTPAGVQRVVAKFKKDGGDMRDVDINYRNGVNLNNADISKADIWLRRGLSISEVARKMGVSASTVSKKLRKSGVRIRDIREDHPLRVQDILPEVCRDIYLFKRDGVTWDEIQTKFGVSRYKARRAYEVGKSIYEKEGVLEREDVLTL